MCDCGTDELYICMCRLDILFQLVCMLKHDAKIVCEHSRHGQQVKECNNLVLVSLIGCFLNGIPLENEQNQIGNMSKFALVAYFIYVEIELSSF